jgi:hypothetical protein
LRAGERLAEHKKLPMNKVVDALEKNIIDVPLGKPSFNDKRYNSLDLSIDFFSPLPKLRGNVRIAFVDGGNTELICAPNFAVGFNRLYFGLFEGNKRLESTTIPQKIEFYVVCYATIVGDKIFYKTELIPVKDEWSKYLPSASHLEFNSFDRTIMLGSQRAPISRVLSVARVFSEWRFSSFIAREELRENDVLVRDGTLQTSVTNERKYANEAYDSALEKGVYFTSLSKTSTLFTSTGLPLFSAIDILSESSPLKGNSWYYHPVVQITQPDHRAEMFAVKLHPQSDYVFRFEVLKDQATKAKFGEIELIISALAENSKDIGFPGYPYGLIDADRFARVSATDQTVNEFQFRASISQKKVWEKISKFVKSSDAHEILNKLIR